MARLRVSLSGNGAPRPSPARPQRDRLAFAGLGRAAAQFFDFPRPQRLAMRAVPADFCARQQHLKAEVTFNLFSQSLQRLAEKLLDFAAAEADHVRMFLFETRLVV